MAISQRSSDENMLIGAGVAAGLGLLWLLTWLNPGDWTTHTRQLAEQAVRALHDTGLHRLLTDPLSRYLDTRAPGLPVRAQLLTWCWAAGGAWLFLRSRSGVYPLVGWLLWGAATTAVVFTATPQPGSALAASMVGLAVVIAPTVRVGIWALGLVVLLGAAALPVS